MRSIILQRLQIGIFIFFMTSFVSYPGYTVSGSPDEDNKGTGFNLIDTGEILKLNEKMRHMVDLHVKPVGGTERRAQALYDIMFGEDKFALKYDNSYTKTAVETIESGSGNCISLASAFIAMGRYAGLDVNYLHFEIPDDWQRESDFYYQYKHISAAVRISSDEYLGIDFEQMTNIDHVRKRSLTDAQGFSAFYSNRGIELLMQGNTDAAMTYLFRAIEIDPDNSNNWSNLGVAYRRQNQLDKAEDSYLQALIKNKSDLSALNNLAILYQMTGKIKIAEEYNKKLERYMRKNPYYMIKLAKEEMEKGRYAEALRWAKKAIKKHGDEHEFYFVAARVYACLGDREEALLNLALAEKYAHQSRNSNMYSRKLENLRNMKKSP